MSQRPQSPLDLANSDDEFARMMAEQYALRGAPDGERTFLNSTTGVRTAVVLANGRIRHCWGGIDGDPATGEYRLLSCAGDFQE